MSLTIGGSQTGGTAKTLTQAGQVNGRAVFAFPEHTALTQRLMTVGTKAGPVTKDSLGFQEASVDFTLKDSGSSETCCSTVTGGVYVNLKLHWDLNQPSANVDTALQYLQGGAFASSLADAIKKGLITFA